MKKFLIFLFAILQSSCWFMESFDEYHYQWNIINDTQQDIIINIMEKENVDYGLIHSQVTKAGSIRTFYFAPYVSNEADHTFNVIWSNYAYRNGRNKIQCEIRSADNAEVLKNWTLSELESDLLDVSKKHFFREEDWERKGNPTKGDCTWTFTLTDEDLK